MKIFNLIFLLFLCQLATAQVDVTYNDLVWSDEFDANGAVNSTKWFHQTKLPAGGGWFNNEVQHYTNRLTNSFVSAGHLNIVAKKETFADQGFTKQYTSARLNSKFAFKYGRVDIKAKVPIEAGTWPALWLLGKNVNELGGFFQPTDGNTNWPACGEIDIMEHGIFKAEPINYVASAIHTPSSSGNTVNKGGTLVKNLGTDFHVYTMNWSPNQLTFLVDGVAYYTYNPPIKDITTWPFDAEQYLLLNIAMGGIAGSIPSNFTQTTMEIDYVRVYQNITPDKLAPTNFTATIGEVTSSSVELLLNAKDDSGNIVYNVVNDTQNNNTTGVSGTVKSYLVTGLNPNTNYAFTVTAKDVANNQAANNPIVLNAKTTANSTLFCSGTSTMSQQGSFSTGYTYEFKTEGSNVKITYTLLDNDKVGVVAYLWKQSPFGETSMKNVTGKTFTHTLTGQTLGSTLNYGVKFAFAGGLAVTPYYTYEVGSTCSSSSADILTEETYTFNNPAKDFVHLTSKHKIDKVELYNSSGQLVLTTQNSENIDIQTLHSGIYMMRLYSQNESVVKKLIIEN
jgi:beta-glucanase (GH16 family)